MKVLVSAFACEPGRGSERGAGWNWSFAAARKHDVWVMTRARSRELIEQALLDRGCPAPRFVHIEAPALRRWAHTEGGVRHYAYYLLWQFAAGREAKRLHRLHSFDVVHQLTYANLWLPTFAWRVDAPFLLGPVGGGPRVPLKLYRTLGLRGTVRELIRIAAQLACWLNPLVRYGWKRAALILVQNEETLRVLPRRYR